MQTELQLSDAIALGRTLAKAKTGHLIQSIGGELYACALGFAGLATGETLETMRPGGSVFYNYDFLEKKWPWTKNFSPPDFLPCGCENVPEKENETERVAEDFTDLMIHLFDDHLDKGWTLDMIIDVVRSLEPKAVIEPAKKEILFDEFIETQEA